MSEQNKKTVEVYEKNASSYLKSSELHDSLDVEKAKRKCEKLQNFIKKNIENFPKGSKAFEIGCGDGSNSEYIKNLGYDITASDVADDFINSAKSKGVKTIKFNVLEDEFPDKYSFVFCWRVFVHFTKEDALEIIKKVYDALDDGGIFIFNAINRETRDVDDEWVDFPNEYHMGVERYYKYFSKEELDENISKTNFQIQDFHKEGGDNSDKWLVYVLKK